MSRPRFSVPLPAFVLVAACQSAAPEPASQSRPSAAPLVAAAESAPPPVTTAPPAAAVPARDQSWQQPAPERLVAIGDLHGDLEATRRVLRLAGAIDAADRWVGGKLVVVQTGDQIDRGDDDRAVIELFDTLADRAEAAGGRVIALNGNHEVMNVALDFRYVTPKAFATFDGTPDTHVPPQAYSQSPAEARGRVAAFFPGGPMARRLAGRDVIAMVGGTVFVHGGVTEETVSYGIAKLNRQGRSWMNSGGPPPEPLTSPEGPVWTRRYSDDHSKLDCEGLARTLAALGARRMVVGHTPHEKGITPACDGKVWRIDTGLAHYYGGATQALEIRGDDVKIIGTPGEASPE